MKRLRRCSSLVVAGAVLLAACVDDASSIGCQWEVTGNDTPINEAIAQAASA